MLALSAAGCVGDGGVSVGSLGSGAVPESNPISTGPSAAPAPVSMGPLLEGPIGAKLAQADRESALKAETLALSSGERKTWRGSRGVYGFVVPGSLADPTQAAKGEGAEECRTFSHTIYFAGRPQTGGGKGCRDVDGTWRIVG